MKSNQGKAREKVMEVKFLASVLASVTQKRSVNTW